MPQAHGMPTVEDWKKLTKPYQKGTRNLKHVFSGRGDNMKQVDGALTLYWRVFNEYSYISTREPPILGALQVLVAACDSWINIKGANPQGALTVKRLSEVQKLRAMAKAQHSMQNAKRRAQAIGNLATTGLAADYAKEAATRGPIQGGGTHRAAVSASSVVALKGDVDNDILSPAEKQALGPVLAILDNHDLSTMSQAQFQAIGLQLKQVHDPNSLNFREPPEVVYLKRSGRVALIAIPNNGRFEDASGQPFDTGMTGNRISLAMYAIDKYGSVLIRKAFGQMNGRNFNHSSLVGGKEVMCAGEMGIRNGTLAYINNNSGHYQPSADLLRSALTWIYAQGIDGFNVKVESTVPGQPHGPWKGMSFCSRGSAAASDWTAQDDLANQL